MPKSRRETGGRETREAEYRHWDCGNTVFNYPVYISVYNFTFDPVQQLCGRLDSRPGHCAKAYFGDVNLPSSSIVTPYSIYSKIFCTSAGDLARS